MMQNLHMYEKDLGWYGYFHFKKVPKILFINLQQITHTVFLDILNVLKVLH